MSDIVERAKAALEGVTPEPWDVRYESVYPLAIRCGLGGIRPQDAEFIAAARTLVPELVAEIEHLRKITDIIDPDSVYREQRDQAWAERDAANAEVERLRDCYAAAIHDLHFWAGCIHSNESIQNSMHSAARVHETRLEADQ